MSTYNIDAKAQQLRHTGIVEPVYAWVDVPGEQKKRRSEIQATTEDGTPLWQVEVSYLTTSFGRPTTAIAQVTVPSRTMPALGAYEIVPFEGLVVSVSPAKGGQGLREYWNADGIAQSSSGRARSETAA